MASSLIYDIVYIMAGLLNKHTVFSTDLFTNDHDGHGINSEHLWVRIGNKPLDKIR